MSRTRNEQPLSWANFTSGLGLITKQGWINLWQHITPPSFYFGLLGVLMLMAVGFGQHNKDVLFIAVLLAGFFLITNSAHCILMLCRMGQVNNEQSERHE